MDINWNLYKRFYYVARCGSTQNASKELLVAQPSLSSGIKQLEEELGCELFLRSHKGMELTPYGAVIYEHVSRAVHAIEQAEAYATAMKDKGSNTVNVAVIDTTLHFFVMAHLDRFKRQYPNIEIKFHSCREIADAEALMDSKTADLAIMHRPSDKARFKSMPVMTISDVLICNSMYSDRLETRTLNAEALKDYSLITHGKGTPSRGLVDTYLRTYAGGAEPDYEFTHISGILRQLRQEFSLAFILENVVQEQLDCGELMKLELNPPLPKRHYYLVRPEKGSSVPANTAIEFFLTAEKAEE